ncbi:MAG: alpha-ketoglutarate-dependent dioxygenase AlkB family protein [Crocinitomicaceae bacterium]|jgi:alkylated DNA repair dioxygenase AlkB
MKNLFKQNKNSNLLPFNGSTSYIPYFINDSENSIFHQLMKEVNWKHDELTLFGKKIITKRQFSFEGDEQIEYTYSRQKKITNPWSLVVLDLKQILEKELNMQFNGCLLNLYNSGEIGMAWHSDNEPELDSAGTIASLSFGATRTFQLKHKQTGEKIEIKLENGSLLLMDMESQQHWLHQLKKEIKVKDPRINLTFRQFKK